jgi:hypothetical protein
MLADYYIWLMDHQQFVLNMIEILPPLGKYEYDTWRILPVKCYIDNSVCL